MSGLDPKFIELQKATYKGSWPIIKKYKAHLNRSHRDAARYISFVEDNRHRGVALFDPSGSTEREARRCLPQQTFTQLVADEFLPEIEKIYTPHRAYHSGPVPRQVIVDSFDKIEQELEAESPLEPENIDISFKEILILVRRLRILDDGTKIPNLVTTVEDWILRQIVFRLLTRIKLSQARLASSRS